MSVPEKLVLLAALFAPHAAGKDVSVPRDALLGDWKCGPTTMVGEDFQVTTSTATTYGPDGRYQSLSEINVQLSSGKVVRTRDQVWGSWSLKGRIVEVRYARVKFLWSDDPSYTVDMGQEDAEAQLRKKDWAKLRIISYGSEMVTTPIESMYKGAEVLTTCVRH